MASENLQFAFDLVNLYRVRYPALELRKDIETTTYNCSQTYMEELPTDECKTWQPQKLLAALVEIEPHAATSGAVEFSP